MANAEVAEELGVGLDAAGDLAQDDAVGWGDGFAVGIYVEADVVGASEGGPKQVAFGAEPFEIDVVVFAVLLAVAEAVFDVDFEGGFEGAAGGVDGEGIGGVGFDDELAFDDFDDVVEGVVYAFDEGAADVDVDAAGEKEEEDGGDGGVPEGEAAAGGLEHFGVKWMGFVGVDPPRPCGPPLPRGDLL